MLRASAIAARCCSVSDVCSTPASASFFFRRSIASSRALFGASDMVPSIAPPSGVSGGRLLLDFQPQPGFTTARRFGSRFQVVHAHAFVALMSGLRQRTVDL